MESAMLCKVQKLWQEETCGESSEIRESKHACIVEAPQIYEKEHWKELCVKTMKIGKGIQFTNSLQSCADVDLLASRMKMPHAKAAVDSKNCRHGK